MIQIAQNPAADALLSKDPLALLVAMVLDQQQPMERAFAGPYLIAQRMKVRKLKAAKIAALSESEFIEIVSAKPAVHRFPAAMAKRIQKLCQIIDDEYGGKAERVWQDVTTATELFARLKRLPGFGEDKAKIFIALLGKQLSVRPTGWRQVSAPYGERGSRMTVADVTSQKTLLEVRAFKQQMKAAGIW
ncbi:MAG: Fe-S cluster assembly protein HesB [Actinobacteria bacterium]|jgi:uncharacterized HhH-GPD family protein|uniref:Unannotated protein n=1 Tax=freshwater metagenome TaxID=449393 RepID=A0A6J6FE03_9ZZZZ|nr:Fe-S cluster assembly protein HesB [Actinomycetota bacterium]